jgi:hypothetical protein
VAWFFFGMVLFCANGFEEKYKESGFKGLEINKHIYDTNHFGSIQPSISDAVDFIFHKEKAAADKKKKMEMERKKAERKKRIEKRRKDSAQLKEAEEKETL